MALSSKISAGGSISEEEYASMENLEQYAKKLKEGLDGIQPDFDAGPVLEGRCSQDEMAQRLLKMAAEVGSGTKSKSEALGHKEYFIPYKYQDRDATKKCREA